MIIKLGAAAAVVLTVGLIWRWNLPRRARIVWAIVVVGFALSIAFFILHTTRNAVGRPPVWDFTCFWIYGTAAVHFHEVYNGMTLRAAATLPEIAHQLVAQRAGPDFTNEVLNPGMLYPPPSLLLFYPLGYFRNIHGAALAWWIFNLSALVALVLVTWRSYFKMPLGLALAFIFIAGFVPTLETLRLGQTTILMTLFAVLFAKDRNETRQGLWLAVAVIAKPLLVFLALYPLVKRQYSTLSAFAATLVGTTLAVIPLIGVPSLVSYFIQSPVTRVPGELYRYPSYQSLFSVLLRLLRDSASHYRFVDNLPFVAISALLVAISGWLCLKLSPQQRPICIALLTSLSLIVYPATLYFYAIVLVLPICVLWFDLEIAPKRTLLVTSWLAEAFLIILGTNYVHGKIWLPGATCTFWAFVLSWIVLVSVAAEHLLRRKPIHSERLLSTGIQ